MALRNRHKWLASRLESAFGVTSDEAVEFCRANLPRMNAFFKDTEDRLFIFYQPPMKQVAVSSVFWRRGRRSSAGHESRRPFLAVGCARARVASPRIRSTVPTGAPD